MSSKDRIGRIRDILLNDWDPLIINGYGPPDEYDRYILGIVDLLDKHCTTEELEQYLARIEKEQMWVPAVSQGISQAARNLIASCGSHRS
jgi:hypothetical protein